VKYDCYDLKNAYRQYLEKQQNYIERLQQMRDAMQRFASVDSFKGAAADAAKSYVTEVQMNVVDSIELALMEYEIRLMALVRDFNANVDSSADAVVEDTVISEAQRKVEGFIKPIAGYEKSIDDVLRSISDIIVIPHPDYYLYNAYMTGTAEQSKETLQDIRDFEKRHDADMDNVKKLLTAIDSALSWMGKTGKPGSYKSGSVAEADWMQAMFDGQIKAFFYASTADPTFVDTVYFDIALQTGLTTIGANLPSVVDRDLLMKILNGTVNAADVPPDLKELFDAVQAYKQGLRIMSSIDPKTGETILKVVSAAGLVLDQNKKIEFLKDLGLTGMDVASRSSLVKLLFGKGLAVTGDDAFKLAGTRKLSTSALSALTKIAGAGDDARNFWKNFGNGIKGTSAADRIDKGLFGISIVVDGIDGFYDERTHQLVGRFDGAEFAGNAAVDTAQFLAPIGAEALTDFGAALLTDTAAGASAGSVVPGLGTVIGAGVGAVATTLNFVKWDEPPKNIYEYWISDPIENGVHDAKNFLCKTFW